MISLCHYNSPVGRLLLAEEQGTLIGLWMEGQKYFPNQSGTVQQTPTLCRAVEWLDAYFRGDRPAISELPLAPAGSAFRREVWGILCRIPYGATTTYAAIAGEIAKKHGLKQMSAQAVGGAVGHNPISIIIPCHRVLGTDGSLTGYAGGLDRKQWLLNWEATTK